MAPHTRQSQTKGTAVNKNNRPIPLESSNLANVNTSTRSRVQARRVTPRNPNQCQHAGKSSLICNENQVSDRVRKALGKRTYAQVVQAQAPIASQTPAHATKRARNIGKYFAYP